MADNQRTTTMPCPGRRGLLTGAGGNLGASLLAAPPVAAQTTAGEVFPHAP